MLRAENLVKRFEDKTALDGLNTEIRRGCIYGLVGPNGSGKSTLMRLMCGVYRPDGGRVTLEGEDIFENIAAKDRILYLSDDLYFPPKSTVEDLCDQVGLLSAGRLLFEKDLDVLKLGFCRVQAAYDHPVDWAATGLAILDKKERGKLVSLLVRGTAEDTLAVLEARRPLFAEALPMTLEEVFIGEMEAAGYDYSNILS